MKNSKGFTLVEMLVATVIFLVIVFPFVTTYVVTGKINQDSFYMKRATDILKLAQEDIRTWNDDILEVLSQRVDGGKLREWKYQKDWTIKHDVKDATGHTEIKEDVTSMYDIFRKALDGEENWKDNVYNVTGTNWQKGMDIYFTVEKMQEKKEQTGGGTEYEDIDVVKDVSEIDIRKGYDLSIRVEKKDDVDDNGEINIIQNGRGIVTKSNDNNGKGYYLKVTLKDGKSKYTLREIPSNYIPLEKYAGEGKILFGGREWLRIFEPTPGDVALMYAPTNKSFEIRQPFDVTGGVRFDISDGWDNLASYLNRQFYNSLAYSTTSLNYTNRNWIKRHTWQIGSKDNEEEDKVSEYVGLLRYSEVGSIRLNVADYLSENCGSETYTLTSASNTQMYLVSNDQVSPESVYNVYPVIYLDRDLYIDNNTGKLYESTDSVLKSGDIVKASVIEGNEVICGGSGVNVLIYFDNNLGEDNLEGQYFEKVRLLVDVVDDRTNKTDDGLKIYTVNNKKRTNYSWLEIRNATRIMEESGNASRFKLIDTMKVDEDAKTEDTQWSDANKDVSIKRAHITKEYELKVWAEYMATDERSHVNPNDYPDKSKLPKNKHEELVLRMTVEKDEPTFVYGDSGLEVDNIANINDNGFIEKMIDYYRIS